MNQKLRITYKKIVKIIYKKSNLHKHHRTLNVWGFRIVAQTETVILFINLLLVSSDCDCGGSGSQVCGSKPDCLLHHGGGGRREAADGPS